MPLNPRFDIPSRDLDAQARLALVKKYGVFSVLEDIASEKNLAQIEKVLHKNLCMWTHRLTYNVVIHCSTLRPTAQVGSAPPCARRHPALAEPGCPPSQSRQPHDPGLSGCVQPRHTTQPAAATTTFHPTRVTNPADTATHAVDCPHAVVCALPTKV
jgi:hypothetical protein